MREMQTRIGDDTIVTKKIKERILDDTIHIYPGKKLGIGVARNLFEHIKVLGVDRWKRRKDMKYDHPDLPVLTSIVDNELTISIYHTEFESGKGKMHNFLVSGIPKDITSQLNDMFATTTRLKLSRMLAVPDRRTTVVHFIFDLETAEIIGRVQTDVRKLFA